jgi:hypothetical protein
MSTKLFAVTSILAVVALARANVSAYVAPYYEGYLSDGMTYVYSHDLRVIVPTADAWTVAGGPEVGEPWIRLYGGVFYQAEGGGYTQPDPEILPEHPNVEYDSFYTTPLGWPNVADQGVTPGFAFGPADTPNALVADWFWTPDGYDHPGDFVIARFTVIAPPEADPATTYVDIDMLLGSRDSAVIPFQTTVGIPEPGSLVLLALGGLALLRRR